MLQLPLQHRRRQFLIQEGVGIRFTDADSVPTPPTGLATWKTIPKHTPGKSLFRATFVESASPSKGPARGIFSLTVAMISISVEMHYLVRSLDSGVIVSTAVSPRWIQFFSVWNSRNCPCFQLINEWKSLMQPGYLTPQISQPPSFTIFT